MTPRAAGARVAGVVSRRTALSLALGGLALAAGRAGSATLPAAGSLASALAAALRTGRPLVVLASTPGCPYCQLVRDNYLAPLQREGQLVIVQLDVGNRDGVIDFAGGASTHDALLRRWRVDVAPTVLFFGRDGREVAPRLVGASRDFYGAYLDQRLDAARRNLR